MIKPVAYNHSITPKANVFINQYENITHNASGGSKSLGKLITNGFYDEFVQQELPKFLSEFVKQGNSVIINNTQCPSEKVSFRDAKNILNSLSPDMQLEVIKGQYSFGKSKSMLLKDLLNNFVENKLLTKIHMSAIYQSTEDKILGIKKFFINIKGDSGDDYLRSNFIIEHKNKSYKLRKD